jgi:hypothetical protein
MSQSDYKKKYLKYKQKYLQCKNQVQYKTKYINVIYEKKPCGNIIERIFTDKSKCTKDEYCICGECKQKKLPNSECVNDKECSTSNCDYDTKTKTGKCSSETSLLKQLFRIDL